MSLLKDRGLFAASSEEPQQVGSAGKDFVQLYTCSKATETIDCPVFLKWQKAALFGGRPNIFITLQETSMVICFVFVLF